MTPKEKAIEELGHKEIIDKNGHIYYYKRWVIEAIDITLKEQAKEILDFIKKYKKMDEEGRIGISARYKNGFRSALITIESFVVSLENETK